MYQPAGHPSHCNYWYAMTQILGLDPNRKEDKEEFKMLVKTGEITYWKWGNGKVSDRLFDTQSILSYLTRERKKAVKELKELTEAIKSLAKEIGKEARLTRQSIKKLMKEVKEKEKEKWKNGD